MLKYLQRIGKAIMLPIAALPIAGILLGVGGALLGISGLSNPPAVYEPLISFVNIPAVTAILTRKSILIFSFWIINGRTIEVTPNTIRVLNKFEPRTFPMAISLLPFIAEIKLTASSGALVPRDTIVRPTITDGIPIFLAIEEAPSTNMSAPFISNTNPIINNM